MLTSEYIIAVFFNGLCVYSKKVMGYTKGQFNFFPYFIDKNDSFEMYCWRGLIFLELIFLFIVFLFSDLALYSLWSGEKTSTKDWPGFLEIKGRVRLDAFQKFLLELPQSRTRAIMVYLKFPLALLDLRITCLSHQPYTNEWLKKKKIVAAWCYFYRFFCHMFKL